MRRVPAKLKDDYAQKVRAMDNDRLFLEYEDVVQPDDYDGCFSALGQFRLDTVKAELKKRMYRTGFLKKAWTSWCAYGESNSPDTCRRCPGTVVREDGKTRRCACACHRRAKKPKRRRKSS